MGMHLMGVYLIGVYLLGMYLMGIYLKDVQSQEPVPMNSKLEAYQIKHQGHRRSLGCDD
jgi:hypothetical protein